jgi:hypothetical protein
LSIEDEAVAGGSKKRHEDFDEVRYLNDDAKARGF